MEMEGAFWRIITQKVQSDIVEMEGALWKVLIKEV
jgi:hypothetical protein